MDAKVWRLYVLNPAVWADAVWERAQAEGLCERRVKGKTEHKWVLTDKGLDLMNEGKQ